MLASRKWEEVESVNTDQVLLWNCFRGLGRELASLLTYTETFYLLPFSLALRITRGEGKNDL